MIEIFIIFGLVIDTFLITSVNDQSWIDNLKTYLGLETLFAVVGCCLGAAILDYIPIHLFKIVGGSIIILLQVTEVCGFEYSEKLNAVLLGADSLIVFSMIPWYNIPILFVSEVIAILGGSYIGSKIIKYIPLREYLSNIVMVCIGISLLL